jgi:hemolysin III
MAVVEVKPRYRGVVHLWAFYVSGLASITLTAVTSALVGGVAAVAAAIYSVTSTGLFGTSTLYHRSTWSGRAELIVRRLDHTMIFLFIAGTYTPLCLLGMPAPTGYWVLGIVWTGALAGVGLRLLWPESPGSRAVPIYIALGWVFAFAVPQLLQRSGVAVLVLLIAGGVLYTVGGVIFATRWPDPWPSTFGFHEFFHVATVLAAVCHHTAIWLVLL